MERSNLRVDGRRQSRRWKKYSDVRAFYISRAPALLTLSTRYHCRVQPQSVYCAKSLSLVLIVDRGSVDLIISFSKG